MSADANAQRLRAQAELEELIEQEVKAARIGMAAAEAQACRARKVAIQDLVAAAIREGMAELEEVA